MLLINMKKNQIKSVESLGQEEILFDADRDNDGRGIQPDVVISMLQQLKDGKCPCGE